MKSNPPFGPARRHAAFTLIELLIVIAIIAILAGLLLQVAGVVQEKASRARAETEIKAVESGLESYKLDMGDYPKDGTTDGGDTSTGYIIKELATNPADPAKAPQYNYRKPFEFPLKMLDGYIASEHKAYDEVLKASTSLTDPFGNPYHYKCPGDPARSGDQFYDLFSLGKKGSTGTNDPKSTDPTVTAKWIKNW